MGKLIIFPNAFIDEQPLDGLMAQDQAALKASTCDGWVFESKRSGFRFVAKLKNPALKNLPFYELSEHTTPIEKKEIEALLLSGKTLGLVSDAGMPCIADPGADLVLFCRQKNIPVDLIVGPSSIFLSLILSGLGGQRFHFEGYLPKEEALRQKRLLTLIDRAKAEKTTMIVMEAPYRNQAILGQLKNGLPKDFYLSVAIDVTLPSQLVYTQKVSQFSLDLSLVDNKPAIFLFAAI